LTGASTRSVITTMPFALRALSVALAVDMLFSVSCVRERQNALRGVALGGMERWRLCTNPLGAYWNRSYYFEASAVEGTGPNESVALEVVEDPTRPLLMMSRNMHWEVGLGTKSLFWELIADKDGTAEATQTIDLSELEYIKCVQSTGVLTMMTKQGSSISIFGGMYLKEQTIGKILTARRASENNFSYNDTFHVANQWEETFSGPDANRTLTEISLPVDVGTAGKQVLGLISQVLLFPIRAVQYVEHAELRRQLKLSAGAKIFEKLRCLNTFASCAEDVLVPAGKPCPS